MKRRELLGTVGGIAAAWPRVGRTQQAGRIYRLAHLSGGTAESRIPLVEALTGGMHDLGYIEGVNVAFEQRHAGGAFERLPALARELIAWKPDVVFVSTTPAALAAKAATTTVPIVFVSVADPIGVGLIKSLARPGGNITGISNIGAELAGKRVELLKEMIPSVFKFAVLMNPDDQNASLQMKSASLAADRLKIRLEPILHIRSRADLKVAFEAAAAARVAAALRMIDPLTQELRKSTVGYAAEFRLPVMYAFREDVLEGGLASYGTLLQEQYRQAASIVHKIFGGARPSDIPVEQPTKLQLAINLKTAKALGLTVPPTLIARADEVIE